MKPVTMWTRLRWRPLAVGLVALLGLTLFAWHALVRPWARAALEQRLGRRVALGGLQLSGSGLVARNVVLYGRAPFAAEPVAFVDRVEVELGGPGGLLSPARIVVDGVDVFLLLTGHADNWRGERGAGGAPPSAARGPQVPVDVRRIRLSGLVRLPGGARVAFRAPRVELHRDGSAPLSAEVEGLVLEWPGLAVARLPRLAVTTTSDGQALVSGRDISLAVPGARPVLAGLTLDGSWRPQGWDVTLSAGEPEELRGPFVLADARLGATGLAVDVRADRLPLAGLSPLLAGSGAGLDRAFASVELHAGFDGRGATVPLQLRTRLSGLDWRHPALATSAFRGVELGADLSGEIALAGDPRLLVRQGRLELFGVPLLVSGTTTLSGRPAGKLTVSSPAEGIACGGALDRQPLAIRQALSGLRMAGRLQVSVALAFDASHWEGLSLDVQLPSLCDVLAEPDLIAANRKLLVEGGAGQLPGREHLPVGSDHPDFTPLARMPEHLVGAFLTAEDSAFYRHQGFELDMIRRALAYNLERGQLMRGASTITQQLTKNLFLTHDRTISRKLAETVLAWRVNELLPKRRVLELYLNVLELGPDIRGVTRAARTYFGKALSELRPLESAHLASLPPNPRGFARRFRDGRVDDGWLHRLYDLLGIMRRRGLISPAEVTSARAGRLTLSKI